MTNLCALTGLFCAALLAPIAPVVEQTSDPAGDFLPTYVGPQADDLDVLSIDAVIHGSKLTLSATLAGAVGTTAGAVYVWGIDRGQGTALFVGGTPSIGAGVLFDSVLVLRADGTGLFNDFLNAANSFSFGASSGIVSVSGNSIVGTVALASIPSTGFATIDYGYNLWPRAPGAGATFVSDFAPDASTIKASVIPEPASWALMIAGFGIVGGALRNRKAAAA
jgi:hypothetical protein